MKSQFKQVGVLMGGASSEREVSLMSGKGVLSALQNALEGTRVQGFEMGKESAADLTRLAAQNFDAVFIALHGRGGEDGTLQGALEYLGIPYTGSGVMASSIAMDKTMTKRVWQQVGLPTPAYHVLRSAQEAMEMKKFPMIFKAPHEGSSIGIHKVESIEQIAPAYAACAALDKSVLAEEFIAGRELTVALLEKNGEVMALPIIEIVAPQGQYDYQNKYFTDVTQYHCPANLPEKLTQEISRIAVQAFKALGCAGWARADVMLRASDQRPFLLEINTSPGMTSHSLVPMAARAAGMSYETLCVQVLNSANLKK